MWSAGLMRGRLTNCRRWLTNRMPSRPAPKAVSRGELVCNPQNPSTRAIHSVQTPHLHAQNVKYLHLQSGEGKITSCLPPGEGIGLAFREQRLQGMTGGGSERGLKLGVDIDGN